MIQQDEVDFAIVTQAMDAEYLNLNILAQERLYLLANRRSDYANCNEISLKELEYASFISVGYDMMDKTEELCRGVGFTPHMSFVSEELFKLDGRRLKPWGAVALVPAHRAMIAIDSDAKQELTIAKLSDPEYYLPIILAERKDRIHGKATDSVKQRIEEYVVQYYNEIAEFSTL